MNRILVVAIDGTTARFFTCESAESPESNGCARLVEREQLDNPANSMHGQELWANTKTGRNRGSNGRAHAYDDRRQNHVVEFERQFAKRIAAKISDLHQSCSTKKLLLVAEPQILGIVRESLQSGKSKDLRTAELAKDICHLNSHDIHEYLANKSLLPARR